MSTCLAEIRLSTRGQIGNEVIKNGGTLRGQSWGVPSFFEGDSFLTETPGPGASQQSLVEGLCYINRFLNNGVWRHGGDKPGNCTHNVLVGAEDRYLT